MTEDFTFTLTDEEKQALKSLAEKSIASTLAGIPDEPGTPPTPRLNEKFGAFVTLSLDGNLRGCIGHVIGDIPLWETVHEMARQAAFHDPRFPALNPKEFERVGIEISILSPLTPCPDPSLIEVGRHGLLINKDSQSGLLLPQVPAEWGWDRETFLAQTCSKAGLPADAWKSPDANLFWFEAEVF